MSNTIGNNSRPATLVRPAVPVRPALTRLSADGLERGLESSRNVSTPVSKPKSTPAVSADQMQQRLSQSRPGAVLTAPRPTSTWAAAAATATPNDLLLDYAKKSGEDLSKGVTDKVLDEVRDGLVERAESCLSPSGTEDLKKFDRARMATDFAKSVVDAGQAQKDLQNATTPAQKAKAMVDLAEAQRDGAEVIGDYLENSAERQRLEEQCQPQVDSRPIFQPATQSPGQRRPNASERVVVQPLPAVGLELAV